MVIKFSKLKLPNDNKTKDDDHDYFYHVTPETLKPNQRDRDRSPLLSMKEDSLPLPYTHVDCLITVY